MKAFVFLCFFLLPFNAFTQNSEFRSYKGNKNKFTSTKKSNTAFNKGNNYFELRDYNNAISQFTITINEDEKQNYLSTDAYLNRASAYLQINELDKAIDDYSIVIQYEKDKNYLLTAYVGRGGIYGFRKKYDKGIDDFTRALKITPNDVDANYNLSRLYIDKKDFSEGIKFLEIAENEYYKQNLNTPLLIASILYMKGIAKYSIGVSGYCDELKSSLEFEKYLVKQQVDFIKKICS
jgi:tetratricopeptide (TPR) repeat protein